MERRTKVAGVAQTERVRVPERTPGRLAGSGITQELRTRLPPDNGLAKASLSAQAVERGNTRGHGIGREADQGLAWPFEKLPLARSVTIPGNITAA
jgi:hypothetical protein